MRVAVIPMIASRGTRAASPIVAMPVAPFCRCVVRKSSEEVDFARGYHKKYECNLNGA
jgi:hypothetical protein